MKYIFTILFIAIFSIIGMSQQLIGVPFLIKKGQTQKAGSLQVKYSGSLDEETLINGSNGKHLDEVNRLHQFEVRDQNETKEFKEVSSFKINGLVVEIIEEFQDSESVKILVMTEKQFGERVLKKVELQSVFDELSKIKTFAIGPTGYAAVTSPGEKLFQKLLDSELAETYFVRILRNGTDEAKLYALYGLHKINAQNSERYFSEYRNHSAQVQTMSGCEIDIEKFSEVLARIEKMK